MESPTNPTLKISDIAAISAYAHDKGALVVVDNTFASPVAQQPFSLGADIIIHSATKYLAGHSDLVAGLVVLKTPKLAEQIKFIQNASGGILGLQDCWLTIRGIETVTLRVERQCQTGLAVARFLENHPAVRNIYYPGRPQHKNHDIARNQMNGLFGGVLAFDLWDDTTDAATSVVCSTKLFKLAESLGGVKSLICQPSEMTNKSIPAEIRRASGVSDSLIRLSCGIEESADLVADIAQALENVNSPKKVGKEVQYELN